MAKSCVLQTPSVELQSPTLHPSFEMYKIEVDEVVRIGFSQRRLGTASFPERHIEQSTQFFYGRCGCLHLVASQVHVGSHQLSWLSWCKYLVCCLFLGPVCLRGEIRYLVISLTNVSSIVGPTHKPELHKVTSGVEMVSGSHLVIVPRWTTSATGKESVYNGPSSESFSQMSIQESRRVCGL